MSFARSRILPLARQTRFFSTSPFRASVLDTAKETVKNVDRTVSDAAVKGIEKAGMFALPSSAALTYPQASTYDPSPPLDTRAIPAQRLQQ